MTSSSPNDFRKYINAARYIKNMNQKVFLALAIFGIIFVSGCMGQPSVKSTAPVDVTLKLSTPPKIGETAMLSMTLISEKHASNATVDFILPDEIEVVSQVENKFVSLGFNWYRIYNGELKANNPQTFEIEIKPIKEGTYELRGRVSNDIDSSKYKPEELKSELLGGNTARISLKITDT